MAKILELRNKDRFHRDRKVGSIEIRNETEEAADLCFFGDINSESWGEWKKYFPEDRAPADVQEFLNQLGDVSKINVHINSGGGSVFGGIAIHNILLRHKAEITVYVEGLAASIASVIAMAGDKIVIPKNAQMMIHKPSSIAWGDADEMRKEADILDGCQKTILSTYMRHAKEGVTEEQINDLINAETWKNGEEWQEYFDIEVSEENTAAAAASDYYGKYHNLPDSLKKGGETSPDSLDMVLAKMARQLEALVGAADSCPEQEKEAVKILEDLDYI